MLVILNQLIGLYTTYDDHANAEKLEFKKQRKAATMMNEICSATVSDRTATILDREPIVPTLIHITDLHLDICPRNLESMLELVSDTPAELFLIGGDNGGDEGLIKTVESLKNLLPHARIAWIRGNHDLWHKPYTHLWL